MLYRNPQLKDRAAAAFELWEVQDGQFTQYAQRYSAAPGTGPAHFIEAIIFKWMASWVMSYWAVLWEGGPHPGTLGDFLEVKKWRDDIGYQMIEREVKKMEQGAALGAPQPNQLTDETPTPAAKKSESGFESGFSIDPRKGTLRTPARVEELLKSGYCPTCKDIGHTEVSCYGPCMTV